MSTEIGVCIYFIKFFYPIVLYQTLNIRTHRDVCYYVTVVFFCCCFFLNRTLLYQTLNSLSLQSALTWTMDTSHHT